jgi:hypothetical protein
MDMSLSEIIDELPRLSHQERRELCRRVIDLESEHDDMMLCDHIAREGFAMLDRMEAEEGAGGRAQRGDVWQVDMGIAGNVRPCLLLTDYPADDELAMP